MTGNVLTRKLLRDMHRSGMQFAALILLCVLGTFLFSGIDGISRMTAATNEKYFEENRLADFWVALPSVDRQALADVRSIPGVEEVCARFSLDMETELPGEPTLNVTAYDGAMTINAPIVTQGEALTTLDRRGCLMQVGFAQANHLQVGDAVTVRLGNVKTTLTVRGLVYSPEYITVTNDFAANPLKYGFVLVNASAFPQLPLSQMVVKLTPDADGEAVRKAIEDKQSLAFVMDRKAHRSTAAAEDNVTMFRSLSIVFPMAAFLVAALIVMTTLTRMIDNQRMQIGTLRALGFSDGAIQRHYLSYAVFPSLLGSVLGAVLGHLSLPRLIWALLIGQSEYPYRILPPISAAAWAMAAVSVLTAMLICLAAYQKAAKETAADLLRPKPPKDGKRILLERIPSLWKKLRFNSKMVVRNLMRSKSRTMMSCIGLMCCSALLTASIGLQNSVLSTVENHYHGTLRYDIRVRLNDQAGNGDAYKARLQAERVEPVMEKSVNLSFLGRGRTSLLTVLEDDQQLFYLGQNETYVRLLDGSIALTDILAGTLNAKVGDSLTFLLPGDDQPFSLPVGSIVYNNFSQGVYMNRSTWEALRKTEFIPTALQISGPSETTYALLNAMDEVEQIDTIEAQSEDALISFNTVSSVFGVLMILALAMAFVICYNMGLINFAERTREYATLKVLGYHQREIRGLILKENALIAVIALVLAVAPGLGLTSVILRVCETDSVRYVCQVPITTILLSSAITFGFSFVIQLLLIKKVRSIMMVEALKSVE
ncbi:MAG: FtsX-like permease family protein [Eubacteriales bacterium]|nr:FtsX-like permease family protein [Eubacteriales bacterium]